MLDAIWKFRWVVPIVIAYVLATFYDHYRTSSHPPPAVTRPIRQIWMLNPIDLEHPGDTALGKIEQSEPLESSQLLKEFRKDAQKARAAYQGKTFIIKGTVIETFQAEVDGLPGNWAWYLSRDTEYITPGVMLSPGPIQMTEEMKKADLGFPLDDLDLPIRVESQVDADAYEKLYRKFLKPDWSDTDWLTAHRRLFQRYSDDFSFLSNFGGVYCMFKRAYHSDHYAFEKMKNIVAACKIRDYLPGGVEDIPEYKRRYARETKKQTKPRVIAVGCIEITSEKTSRYLGK